MTHSDLERRIRRLEDIDEIRRLKARYCEAVDGGWNRRGYDGDLVASLFVEDGDWEIPHAKAKGRDAIAKAINGLESFPFKFHRISNENIEIYGDRATGRWHLIVRLLDRSAEPFWSGGIYSDSFVRTVEGWRFERILSSPIFFGPLEEHWQGGWTYNR